MYIFLLLSLDVQVTRDKCVLLCVSSPGSQAAVWRHQTTPAVHTKGSYTDKITLTGCTLWWDHHGSHQGDLQPSQRGKEGGRMRERRRERKREEGRREKMTLLVFTILVLHCATFPASSPYQCSCAYLISPHHRQNRLTSSFNFSAMNEAR